MKRSTAYEFNLKEIKRLSAVIVKEDKEFKAEVPEFCYLESRRSHLGAKVGYPEPN